MEDISLKKFFTKIIAAMVSLLMFSLQFAAAASVLNVNSQEREGEITHIVLHFTSNVIENPQNPYDIQETFDFYLENEVSVHYFIDRDGTVHAAVPEERTAWHAGRGELEDFPHYKNRLNHHSIGIEILGIGSLNDMEQYISEEEYSGLNPEFIGFTRAQYAAVNELVNDIIGRHPAIQPNRKHVIGHSEYSSIGKTDPGELFDWSELDFIVVTK
jgi:N-acetyl-anhydromuramyl-L-alanine amidase AmpD